MNQTPNFEPHRGTVKWQGLMLAEHNQALADHRPREQVVHPQLSLPEIKQTAYRAMECGQTCMIVLREVDSEGFYTTLRERIIAVEEEALTSDRTTIYFSDIRYVEPVDKRLPWRKAR